MEKTKINPITLIITVVALAAIVTLLVISSHSRSPFVPTPPPETPSATTAATSPSVCYYLNAPSKGALGNDIAYFKATINSDRTATGELGTAIAEKDKQDGTLTGTITNDPKSADDYIFDGQYKSTGEGMSNIAEQYVRFSATEANVGYGTAPDITYSLSIPRVDCEQYDSLKHVQSD